MKVLGFMTVHYGKEYLRESLLSVVNYVNEMVIAYSKYPSHGQRVKQTCPDTEEEIFLICKEVLGDKFIWRRSDSYANEATHRDVRYHHASGYDLILSIDADEVYKEFDIQNALTFAFNNQERYYGINGYVNFWRSFNFACYDGFRPIRIENLNNNNQKQNLNCPLTVYHFSTCQSEPVLRYKMKAFGHASEIRKNWFDEKYYAWTPDKQVQDIHPVSINLWNAVPFDKELLPEYLKQHPNFNKILI